VDPVGREVIQLLCDLVTSFDVPVESTPDLASPETLARAAPISVGSARISVGSAGISVGSALDLPTAGGHELRIERIPAGQREKTTASVSVVLMATPAPLGRLVGSTSALGQKTITSHRR